MREKNQTPLGYLMALMDVSLSDLSEYLYVAQTSISKWKTGARPLRPESAHFDGIVEYFTALARDPSRGKKLTELMEQLYPESRPQTPRELSRAIRSFLGGKTLPPTALHVSMREQGKLYSAQVDVYSGAEGRRNAFLQLLNYAASQPKPASILMSDAQVLARAVGDEKYLTQLIEQLKALLDAGWSLRFLMQQIEPDMLANRMAALLSHDNLQVRMLSPSQSLLGNAVFCLVENHMLLQGMSFAGKPMYSAVHTDDFSLAQYKALFEAQWEAASPAFERRKIQAVNAESLRAMRENTVNEPIDLCLPSLPYLTMGRALLMEVLEVNGVAGHNWTRVLGCREALRGVKLRLLLPASTLYLPDSARRASALPILSAMMGKPMRISVEQARRHMLDTAAMLRTGGKLEILLRQGEAAAENRPYAVFCRRNAFGGYMSFVAGTLSVTMHPNLVEGFSAHCDAATSTLTDQLSYPDYVAYLLEREALEAEPPL